MKKVMGVYGNSRSHWVGDGFPVRTLFAYDTLGKQASPFLMLDYAGPAQFDATTGLPRGVGQHPHRGFETVTIVYQGEVEHRDSAGNGGVIGPGDVQWMTAASGILHEEFHSREFTRRGGTLEMVQLWVNLPAKDKMSPPAYQGILERDIPVVDLPSGAGSLRVIAGEYQGSKGPARTFTPIETWDIKLNKEGKASLHVADGHMAALVVLHGTVLVNGQHSAREAQMVLFEHAGSELSIEAADGASLILLAGEPIAEPIFGHGPFVMNTRDEIVRAIEDFNSGRFGQMAA